MLTMAPDRQFQYLVKPDRAYFGGAPSLVALDAAYGKDTGVMWLMAQLFDLGELSGARDKMSPKQAEDFARIIRAKYGYLKTSELMLFFGNIKAGVYGQLFYGAVDALKIAQALRQAFLPARADAIARHESEQEDMAKTQWLADGLTFDEYARRAGYPADMTAVDVLLAARKEAEA